MAEDNKKNKNTKTDEIQEKDSVIKNDSIQDIKEKTTVEKLEEAEEKSLRLLAEIENQRKRFEKEVKDAFEFGFFNFAKESLAILDNLQRAKLAIKNDDNLKTNKDLDKFLENIIIIEKDLISIFEKNNIKKIDKKDKKFDPNFHQAMSEVENESIEPGTVLQDIQAGYMLGERLLRPSLVSVSKKKEKNKEKKEQK